MKLVGKENLLDAKQSTRRVVVTMAVEQAAVPEARIAVAVTGLLSQHAGDILRDSIRFETEPVPEKLGTERHRQRLSCLLRREKWGHATWQPALLASIGAGLRRA